MRTGETQQPQSSGITEQTLDGALVEAETHFRELTRAVFRVGLKCTSDTEIAERVGRSKPWVSKFLAHPRTATVAAVRRVLLALPNADHRSKLLQAWNQVIDPTIPTEDLPPIIIDPIHALKLADRYFCNARPDKGLRLLLNIDPTELSLSQTVQAYTSRFTIAATLSDLPTAWDATEGLLTLSQMNRLSWIEVKARTLKAQMLRTSMGSRITTDAFAAAESNLNAMNAAAGIARTRGEFSREDDLRCQFQYIRETLLLQAAIHKPDNQALKTHLADQAQRLDRFIGKGKNRLWDSSVYELKARLHYAIGDYEGGGEIVMTHLATGPGRWTITKARFGIMAAKYFRGLGRIEPGLRNAEACMTQAWRYRDIHHYELLKREWSIMRGIEFPPSRPVF